MLKKIAERLSLYLLFGGIFSLLFMLLVNFVDVFGAKLFNKPLPGATEYTSLFQVVAISTAIAHTLLERRHIRIDFFVDKFKERIKKGVVILIIGLEICFFVVIVWRGSLYAYSLMKSGELGATSELAFYPFAFILALSAIPVLLILIDRFIEELRR
jgi:TRAP-type C4-dicarboxylate transport system permease small subunit